MKNLFIWNTFMQWKPVAIKEQKVTENQAGSDDATTDKNRAPAETQVANHTTHGMSYEERWDLVQYFSDWIKNADVRIQMLLAVQGFIVAAYGTLIPVTEKISNFWNLWTYIWTACFVISVITSFKIGFYQRPNMSVSGKKGNIFFYGSYDGTQENLNEISIESKLQYLTSQLSTLAGIASNKFKNVQNLQSSVFMSAIFLVLFLIGFTPWISQHVIQKNECLVQLMVCTGIIICIFMKAAIKDMYNGLFRNKE